MNLTYKKLNLENLHEISREYEALPAAEHRLNQHINRAWFEGELKSELSHCFGGFVKEQLASVIFFNKVLEVIEITFLFRSSLFYGKGVMRACFAQLLASEMAETIWLEVHEENIGAQKLYESLGFLVDGRRSRYYSDGKDAILMTLQCKPLK